jgi:hypothetical protein
MGRHMAILITSTTGETHRSRAANLSLSHAGRFPFDNALGIPSTGETRRLTPAKLIAR